MTKQFSRLTRYAGAAAIALLPATVNAQSVSGSATYTSAYLARNGVPMSQGAAIQVDATVATIAVDANAWLSYGLPEREITEVDLTIKKHQRISERIELTYGGTYFEYPSGNMNRTAELFFQAERPGKINVSASAYADFIDGTGLIGILNISKTIPFGRARLTPYASAAYNAGYFWDKYGLSHANMGMSAEFDVTKQATLSAYINRQIPIHKDYNKYTIGGVNLKWKTK
jgi:hypothetical protein